MKTVAVVQARMNSSRLPGKMLMDIAGKPMLLRVLERCARARSVDSVVVAIPDTASNARIEELCAATGFTCFKGSEQDVLDRVYRTAVAHCADVVVRIFGHCPLIDPALIDSVVSRFQDHSSSLKFISNCFPSRTYPEGLEVEVLGMDTLNLIWSSDPVPEVREHITPFLFQNGHRISAIPVTHTPDLSRYALAVDTRDDLARIDLLLSAFADQAFLWQEAIKLLDTSKLPSSSANSPRRSSPERAG